jgi:hypothetical protein
VHISEHFFQCDQGSDAQQLLRLSALACLRNTKRHGSDGAAFAVFAATGSVFAQDFVTPDANVASTRTRAEVIAEIAQARANGTLEIRDTTYPVLPVTASSKTRAEVAAEIAQARANDTLDIRDTTYPGLPATASSKTRAEVLAELKQYQEAHPNGEDIYIYSSGA